MPEAIRREFVGITDQALAALQQRLGQRIEHTLEPWCYEATRDNIRHYAHGIGDDYGPERCSWLSHAMTNWIGDDGMLHTLTCEIRRHTILRGTPCLCTGASSTNTPGMASTTWHVRWWRKIRRAHCPPVVRRWPSCPAEPDDRSCCPHQATAIAVKRSHAGDTHGT